MLESQRHTDDAELVELAGSVEPGDGDVLVGRAQVLADGKQSQPAPRRSRIVSTTSSRSSAHAHDYARLGRDCGVQLLDRRQQFDGALVVSPGRTLGKTRRLDSMLWLSTSGRARTTVFSPGREPSKSGMRTSTLQPGVSWLILRIHMANMKAPPSVRSSLFTEVMTQYLRPSRFTV